MPPVLQAPLIVRVLLLLIFAAGVYFFGGFLVPVLAALIIGFASWPLYRRVVQTCNGNTTQAATIALLVVICALIAPLSIALHYALDEASGFVRWVLEANRMGAPPPQWIEALPMIGERLAGYWRQHLSQPNALGHWVQLLSGEHLGDIYRTALAATRDLFHLALTLLFMLITLFFVYKDGARIAAQLDIAGERILPLRWQRFSRVVPTTVSATVTGMGLIAIGEGVVLGIAYAIAGVPSPVLLGVVTGFMALIPGGAPLSFTLVSLYLVGSGSLAAGVGLFIWGTVELFIVDKTLRPRLVGGPVKLPFLPTFFGLVGGVQTMGLVGLFVGPVLMALLVAVWREWLLGVQSTPLPLANLPAQADPVPNQQMRGNIDR
ncbi:AI-2E family transporter [Parazoarcus communis]|uniref:AI-2E family transporter n=1 Tax=Parazoarcus communis SWub3 = DSM 12120 TaxID=1121029 RepID=A0A323V0Z8_9RHOO|nr:AI-2E family transporter [Parazoarcus communis]NMG69150.1 AI-2E family transporter [Parazoarcus communis SWub3 = DSM 12120]PZA18397.1 AI-2E family transporter [Azoarcus communis] [Parazoarcus communis SWub3 = DSM 12120]